MSEPVTSPGAAVPAAAVPGVPPRYFRAAAGNLVREDDPLVVAFREMADRIGELCRALDLVLVAQRARVIAMHHEYRRRQLARHRRRR